MIRGYVAWERVHTAFETFAGYHAFTIQLTHSTNHIGECARAVIAENGHELHNGHYRVTARDAVQAVNERGLNSYSAP